MMTNVLRDQQYMFGVRSLLAAEKDKEQPGWHVVATTDATIATVYAFIYRWDKCLNKFGQYVEK